MNHIQANNVNVNDNCLNGTTPSQIIVTNNGTVSEIINAIKEKDSEARIDVLRCRCI